MDQLSHLGALLLTAAPTVERAHLTSAHSFFSLPADILYNELMGMGVDRPDAGCALLVGWYIKL